MGGGLMDDLDRVLAPGRDLLNQVDAALASYGAPDGHPVVPLLRRLRVLPGAALEQVARLDAQAVSEAAVGLRVQADRYAGHQTMIDSAAGAVGWEGAAAESFRTLLRSLCAYLGEAESADEANMAGRVLAMLAYLDAVGAWIAETRADVAVAVAEVLGSAEAVALRSLALSGAGTDPTTPAPVVAASAIGARILRAVDQAVAGGHQVYERWAPRLAEQGYTPPEAPAQPGGGHITVLW
ncbi:MAG: hypothetical protein JXA67_15175 [Micromonosporaceae bacterium]|nr:hypothetical protein [Micromonosporaceae bacterium]